MDAMFKQQAAADAQAEGILRSQGFDVDAITRRPSWACSMAHC